MYLHKGKAVHGVSVQREHFNTNSCSSFVLLNYVINYQNIVILAWTSHSKWQNSYFEVQFLCQRSTSSGQLPTALAKRAMLKSYRQQEMQIHVQLPQTSIFSPALWTAPKTTEIYRGQISEFLVKKPSNREVRNR
jgi:hypothetical protein